MGGSRVKGCTRKEEGEVRDQRSQLGGKAKITYIKDLEQLQQTSVVSLQTWISMIVAGLSESPENL